MAIKKAVFEARRGIDKLTAVDTQGVNLFTLHDTSRYLNVFSVLANGFERKTCDVFHNVLLSLVDYACKDKSFFWLDQIFNISMFSFRLFSFRLHHRLPPSPHSKRVPRLRGRS